MKISREQIIELDPHNQHLWSKRCNIIDLGKVVKSLIDNPDTESIHVSHFVTIMKRTVPDERLLRFYKDCALINVLLLIDYIPYQDYIEIVNFLRGSDKMKPSLKSSLDEPYKKTKDEMVFAAHSKLDNIYEYSGRYFAVCAAFANSGSPSCAADISKESKINVYKLMVNMFNEYQ